MNKKGFTLIELLGVIIILSIIMLIAIPNIASMIQKNKKQTYIVDAKKMVSLVQYSFRKGSINKPAEGSSVTVTLLQLSTSDVEKDSDGKPYHDTKSYVKVTRTNGYLKYRVQLVTCSNTNSNICDGIKETDIENLDGNNKYNYYNENETIN